MTDEAGGAIAGEDLLNQEAPADDDAAVGLEEVEESEGNADSLWRSSCCVHVASAPTDDDEEPKLLPFAVDVVVVVVVVAASEDTDVDVDADAAGAEAEAVLSCSRC